MIGLQATPQTRASSTQMASYGARPLSQVLQLVKDMASPPTLMTLGPVLSPAIDGKKWRRGGRYLSLVWATTQQTRNRAASPQSAHQGPALLCCPFSRVLQLVRGKDSYSALRTPGPGFPPATGGEGRRGRRISLLIHTTWQDTSCRASSLMYIS